ncbi:MAG: phenylacetic acid degradation operon negative regulatory protein PaaX, partial [Gammaproteobacteria bacterium]
MPRLKKIDELLANFAGRMPVRAGSLIISLFGDSISQHGNSVWLGSLIRALEPFGLNARQIRTAVFRLVQEDWLGARQIGRRSFYSLTESGTRQYERAARRIYAGGRLEWDGVWTVVVPAFVRKADREILRRELLWQGYGQLTPGIFAHPAAGRRSLDEALHEQGVTDKVIVLHANSADLVSAQALARLSRDRWGLDVIAGRYLRFLETFEPILKSVNAARGLDPQQCFQLRILLIHEYRRIILHDADLPVELLPAKWPGHRASELTATLYRGIHRPAMNYLTQVM